jgi:hypothetical protein
MACLDKSNDDNYLTWWKVNGTLTFADLQANGVPNACDYVFENSFNLDFSLDFKS